jgi:CDP-glycerol glycerophosphotransferase (TagB/SpsB family)
LSRYGERLLSPLAATGWRIIVRPHPQSRVSEAAVLERLAKRYAGAPNLEWDYARDNVGTLSRADVMISDFSGVVFDYVFLFDKPVIYVKQGLDLRPYDAGDLGEGAADRLWQFTALREFGVELREEYFEHIGDVIKNAAASAELKAARRKARDEAWQYPGEAGKRTADFMISVLDGK